MINIQLLKWELEAVWYFSKWILMEIVTEKYLIIQLQYGLWENVFLDMVWKCSQLSMPLPFLLCFLCFCSKQKPNCLIWKTFLQANSGFCSFSQMQYISVATVSQCSTQTNHLIMYPVSVVSTMPGIDLQEVVAALLVCSKFLSQ